MDLHAYVFLVAGFADSRIAVLSHGFMGENRKTIDRHRMNKQLETDAFLSLSENNAVIDVRSPNEYLKGHIPYAISLPLFSNEERAEVGTLYKSQGRQAAIKKGLELVGPKIKTMIAFAEGLEFKEALLVHCWRGGMRSESVAWLFHFTIILLNS